ASLLGRLYHQSCLYSSERQIRGSWSGISVGVKRGYIGESRAGGKSARSEPADARTVRGVVASGTSLPPGGRPYGRGKLVSARSGRRRSPGVLLLDATGAAGEHLERVAAAFRVEHVPQGDHRDQVLGREQLGHELHLLDVDAVLAG